MAASAQDVQAKTNGSRDHARSVVDAAYTGVVPDTFKDEAEVVLKGRLTADGFHTEASGVMAKCPSKYDPNRKPTSAGS